MINHLRINFKVDLYGCGKDYDSTPCDCYKPSLLSYSGIALGRDVL